MKSVVALLLVLEATQALWLNADADEPEGSQVVNFDPKTVAANNANKPQAEGAPAPAPGSFGMPSQWGPPVKPPLVKPGTGEVINSGDSFALESEAEPGLFVTLRPGKPDDMGAPMKWLEMKHITNGQFGLQGGIKKESTFEFFNQGKDLLKSGDMTKWTHAGDSQIDLLMAFESDNAGEKAWMWPHPLVKKAINPKEPGDFLIEHAREVDLAEMTNRPNVLGAWGFDQKVRVDPRRGEAIKDGDSVWIRHKGTTGSTGGDWLWMSGDPAEGYHVAFPHHFPGFDGRVKHYAPEHWNKGGNDPHATAQRFTIRKVAAKPQPQESQSQQPVQADPNAW